MSEPPLEGEVSFDPREIKIHDPYIIPSEMELANEVTRPKWWYAHQLRLAGASWGDIAKALGYVNPQRAESMVRANRKAELVDLKEVLQDELDRLDLLQFAMWRRATQGEVQAVKAVLDIMATRHRILGLADKNVATSETASVVVIGGTEDDYIKGLQNVVETEKAS